MSLYRTFKSNYVPYFPDGAGRDRYIAYNNAGFYKNYDFPTKSHNDYKTSTFFSTKIPLHMKTSSVKTPNFHYHADGNGRDKYIIVNGGGLFTDSKPLISYKLTDFLRNNEDNLSPIRKTKTYFSRDEIKYNKLLRGIEKNLVKRLYTNEKKKFIKRPRIMNNLNTFSSLDEINKDGFNTNTCKNMTKSKLFERYNSQKNSTDDLLFNSKETIPIINRVKKQKIIKPKIIIDASINNNLDINTRNNDNINKFITDYETIKKYQFKNNSVHPRRKPYFHIQK